MFLRALSLNSNSKIGLDHPFALFYNILGEPRDNRAYGKVETVEKEVYFETHAAFQT